MFERTFQGVVQVIRGNDPLIKDHAQKVMDLMTECLEHGQPRVLLDMEKIPLIDSAGLELLVDSQENFQQRGGALKLVAPNGLCQEILSITGVGSLFEVFQETVSAAGSFAQ
jgi:anti-anti-sigma factor